MPLPVHGLPPVQLSAVFYDRLLMGTIRGGGSPIAIFIGEPSWSWPALLRAAAACYWHCVLPLCGAAAARVAGRMLAGQRACLPGLSSLGCHTAIPLASTPAPLAPQRSNVHPELANCPTHSPRSLLRVLLRHPAAFIPMNVHPTPPPVISPQPSSSSSAPPWAC